MQYEDKTLKHFLHFAALDGVGDGGTSASGHRPEAFEIKTITSYKIWQSRTQADSLAERAIHWAATEARKTSEADKDRWSSFATLRSR